MIVVDTSTLVDALTGEQRSGAGLRAAIAAGERLALPTLVHYEWLRGPRKEEELAVGEALFPSQAALPFGLAEARAAVELYRSVPAPRGCEIDLAVAAHAITLGGSVWTLNVRDFSDLPGLELYEPPSLEELADDLGPGEPCRLRP